MKKYIYLLFIACTFTFFSCQDWLEEKVYASLTTNVITDSEESAQFLVNGALSLLNGDQFFLYGHYFEASDFDSDHMIAGDWAMQSCGQGNFYNASAINSWWSGRYNLIYNCNYTIDKIEEMQSISEPVKNNMLGQMYFLKGWAYFQLVQAYGPVPVYKTLVEHPEDPKEYNRPRQSVAEVYSYTIECLQKASSLLYERNNPKYEQGRVSKYTAMTVMAQAYCAMASGSMPQGTVVDVIGGLAERIPPGKTAPELIDIPTSISHSKIKLEGYNFNSQQCYQRVKEICDSIISYSGFKLYNNYMDVWKLESRNGPEFIWQLQAGMKSGLMNAFSFGTSGEIDARGVLKGAYFGMRHHWYRLFEKQDSRAKDGVYHFYAQQIVGTWGGEYAGTPWMSYYPREDSLTIRQAHPGDYLFDPEMSLVRLTKFNAVTGKEGNDASDYFYPFLRLPIVYLMLAEAENELGDPAKAKNMLDVVRGRSKASLVSTLVLSQVQIRSMVLEERAREFSLEGVRRWDLLRWGIYESVMDAVVREGKIQKYREPKHILFPLPANEINANSAINENNPGW